MLLNISMYTEVWRTITRDEVESSLTALEMQLFSKEVTDVQPQDRICNIIHDTIAMVRGFIAGCDKNVLSEDECLLPNSCRFHTLAIIRYRLLTALPGYTIEESRTNEYNSALTFLNAVAACTIGISVPEGEIVDVPSNILTPTIVSNRRSRFNRFTETGW